MDLKSIRAFLGPKSKKATGSIKEGEAVVVQRRNGRLVLIKAKPKDGKFIVLGSPTKDRRVGNTVEFVPGEAKVSRLPKPEDFIFKVSSGR